METAVFIVLGLHVGLTAVILKSLFNISTMKQKEHIRKLAQQRVEERLGSRADVRRVQLANKKISVPLIHHLN